jgi:hypothetical protein
MRVTELRSLKAFRAWLRDHGPRGQWFGRIGFGERSLPASRGRARNFDRDRRTNDCL